MKYTSDKIRQVLTLNGINVTPNIQVTIKGILILLITIYLFAQVGYMMILNWDSKEQRFSAIEQMNLLALLIVALLENTFMPTDMDKLLEISDSGYFNVNFINEKYTNEKLEVIKSMENNEKFIINKMLMVISIVTVSQVFQPILISIYSLIVANVSVDEFHLPILFYNIFSPKMSYPLYVMVYLVQAFIWVHMYAISFDLYAAPMCALRNVTTEMKVFTINLRELDETYHEIAEKYEAGTKEFMKHEDELKVQLGKIVKHHQIICRKAKEMNEGAKILQLNANQACGFQLCMALCAYEEGDMAHHMKDLVMILPLLFVLFVSCFNGQILINMGEELRESLNQSLWYKKPLWYKKTLVLMILRANHVPELKPFGLYVVNYNAYKTVIQASYSYYNFLHNFN